MNYIRKKILKAKCGGCSDRQVARMVEDGRIPPPEYPFGARTPLWDEEKLDAHIARLAAAGPPAISDAELARRAALNAQRRPPGRFAKAGKAPRKAKAASKPAKRARGRPRHSEVTT
jgi:hypothetical protein